MKTIKKIKIETINVVQCDGGRDGFGVLVHVVAAFFMEGQTPVAELEVALALGVGDGHGPGGDEGVELIDLGHDGGFLGGGDGL